MSIDVAKSPSLFVQVREYFVNLLNMSENRHRPNSVAAKNISPADTSPRDQFGKLLLEPLDAAPPDPGRRAAEQNRNSPPPKTIRSIDQRWKT